MNLIFRKAILALLLIALFPLVIIEPIVNEFFRAWRNLYITGEIRRNLRRYKNYWVSIIEVNKK